MLTIGRIAALTGLTPKAVRLYESGGLIDRPQRTRAGYRIYTEQALPVLHFIRQAQALGLTLKEIKQILDLQRTGTQPCGLVTTLLDDHLAELDRRIADLESLRHALRAARDRAGESHGDLDPEGAAAPICPIIQGLPNSLPDGTSRPRSGASHPARRR
ncbi:heavy metal-responsive transcriptional regulator [Streptomyces sp. NPDC050485]|uniref:heavy metal-responsive transcriptional regulator n=1 Tax=Streptomyces sp. NPDC050485 TaxID=3365617 RepID=UPI0037AD789F